VAIIFLGRYMMSGGRYEEVANVPLLLRWIGLPFALLFRAFLTAVMAIIDAAEGGVLALSRAIGRALGRQRGASLLGQRAAGRALAALGIFVLTLILLFELFPFYWMIITAFKTEEQIEGAVNIF
jgi:hypothetical protein